MKIKGLPELRKQIRNIERNNQRAINKGIQATARLILQQALSNVPADSNHLRSTIGQENRPEEMSAVVYAAALYAAYVEFGTGTFVEVPAGYEDYAMEFFVSGEGRGKPQPYMLPALFANQEKLVPLIEAELIKLLKSM